VMVEAMACGTPAVSLANGAAAEVIEPGVTGYLAGSADELAGAVLRAMDLDRQAVRDRAQTRFDIAEVAASYRRLYEDVVAATTDEGRGTSLTSALPGA
jgi:glycosyltransferase involved in cell wall biosynthesis